MMSARKEQQHFIPLSLIKHCKHWQGTSTGNQVTFVGGGKVTEFHENNTLTAQHNQQNVISAWTKPDSGRRDFPLWKIMRWLEKACLWSSTNISKSYLDKLHKTEEMTDKISLWAPCYSPGSHGNLSKSNWWPSKWQGNHPGLSGPLNLTLILTRDDGGYQPISIATKAAIKTERDVAAN